MAVELNEIVELLRREFPFQGLNDEQLLWVADQFQPRPIDRNTVVFSQGSPGDYFYIVFSGKVRVIRRIQGTDQPLNLLSPGDFFGEESLLTGRLRSATIVTVESTVLLQMGQDQFKMMLAAYPSIRDNLVATAESRRLARARHFDWLGANEVIYFITRKHDLFLLGSLILPILLGVGSIPVLSIALAASATSFPFNLLLILGIGMLVLSIVWGVWNFVDWGNDFYIVTSQRVVWLEKLVGLYDSRREAPLDTVLAVNVVSSQIGRWLKYGNVNVRTFTGGILMRNANQPYRFSSFVEGYKKRVIQVNREEEAKAIETALEQALTKTMLVTEGKRLAIPTAPPPYVPPKEKPKPQMTFRERLRNFLKVRYVQGNVITYRKHWFVLMQKAWQPLLANLALLASAFFLLTTPIISPLIVLGSSLFVFIFTGGWLVYDYLDWSNDIYRLTPEQIFDIERKPLGQENKKTAPLESILSIEHERTNLLGIILNFGQVTINVGQTKFTFDGVYNPDQVHADVADYREALNRKKRTTEAQRERERMVNWLVTFYNQTERMTELNDISEEDEF